MWNTSIVTHWLSIPKHWPIVPSPKAGTDGHRPSIGRQGFLSTAQVLCAWSIPWCRHLWVPMYITCSQGSTTKGKGHHHPNSIYFILYSYKSYMFLFKWLSPPSQCFPQHGNHSNIFNLIDISLLRTLFLSSHRTYEHAFAGEGSGLDCGPHVNRPNHQPWWLAPASAPGI